MADKILSPEERRRLNRLSRVIGHLQYTRRLMEEGADCSDVLMQLAASRSALNNLGKELLNDHLTECVEEALTTGDQSELESFREAVRRYM